MLIKPKDGITVYSIFKRDLWVYARQGRINGAATGSLILTNGVKFVLFYA